MHRQIHPAFQQGLVQLFDEQPFAPHLVQGAVQDLVSRGLHGHQFDLGVRVGPAQRADDDLGLDYRQPAFPAANSQFHSFSISLIFWAHRATAL